MDEYHEMYGSKPNPIWKLAESVSIVEAALLILDIEPQGVSAYVENYRADQLPLGYLAARNAVASALKAHKVEGDRQQVERVDGKGQTYWDENSVDVEKSSVEIDSLRAWLSGKDFSGNFFASRNKEPSFKSKMHPRYSPKLAAVVEAWEAYEDNQDTVGTPKQRLEKWLRLNAARFGFTDESGAPQEQVIKDLAKVANWATRGGAPKQIDEEPNPF